MQFAQRTATWLKAGRIRLDLFSILVLTLLWAFYFWRVITPNPVNQVSYPTGDFSGQFVAFGAYQARRLLSGEIPLWNPYNYAGHPFLADTQAAVFYPPRLMTIFISQLFGGWSYGALQIEAIGHVWLGSIGMYLYVRRLTDSSLAGLVSAITLSFGGYQTGYPPLQLAVLEAGIWLPFSLLGIYNASQHSRWQFGWLALSSLSLGLSLLAGHPQTTLFLSYLMLAYIIYRAYSQKLRLWQTVLALLAVFGLGYGLAAVQIIPGLEFMRLTIRAEYGYDALSGGFPFVDLINLIIPNIVTEYSPLYSGIAGLVLSVTAVCRRKKSAWFWGGIGLLALGISFGSRTILHSGAFLFAPGFSWFRGQERLAYVIAYSVAILTGLGTSSLLERPPSLPQRKTLGTLTGIAWFLAIQMFIISRFIGTDDAQTLTNGVVLMAFLMTLTWLAIAALLPGRYNAWWPAAITTLIVFDLFSLTWKTNWEPIPASERHLYSTLLVDRLQQDTDLYRVEGKLGLRDNHGTLLGIQDIYGISPLRLSALDAYWNHLPNYRLYQLLAVKYVLTDWMELEKPSTILVSDDFGYYTNVNLHELTDPYPRAWMVHNFLVAEDDDQALAWLADPNFDPRSTVILDEQPPEFHLPTETSTANIDVLEYKPESIVLSVNTDGNGYLVVSEWYYPGWRTTIDGINTQTLRANAGLRAIPVPAGGHTIKMTYQPLSYWLGAGTSLLSLVLCTGIVLQEQVGHVRRQN